MRQSEIGNKVPVTMIHTFQIGNMRNFVYLITFDKQSFVVDPQPDLTPWEKTLSQLQSKLCGVLLTHTHYDHVGGVAQIAEKYKVPIYVHPLDEHRLLNLSQNVRSFFSHLEDKQILKLGNQSIDVLHTPGHSAGECSFLISTENSSELFTGDTVFVGDVGRTDLETGSTQELFFTIERLKSLPKNTIIYPGHDYGKTPTSTIGRECQESAAFQCQTVKDLEALP